MTVCSIAGSIRSRAQEQVQCGPDATPSLTPRRRPFPTGGGRGDPLRTMALLPAGEHWHTLAHAPARTRSLTRRHSPDRSSGKPGEPASTAPRGPPAPALLRMTRASERRPAPKRVASVCTHDPATGIRLPTGPGVSITTGGRSPYRQSRHISFRLLSQIATCSRRASFVIRSRLERCGNTTQQRPGSGASSTLAGEPSPSTTPSAQARFIPHVRSR